MEIEIYVGNIISHENQSDDSTETRGCIPAHNNQHSF